MSIAQLPSLKFRVQIRQKGYPRFDVVLPTLEAAEAAQTAEFARRAGETIEGPKMPLREAAGRYLSSSLYADKADSTRRQERQLLVPVIASLGEYSLEHIATHINLITAYRDARRRTISERTKKKIGIAKVRCELAALSSIFIWAVEERLFSSNPVAGIKRGTSKTWKRRLKGDESTMLKLLAERAKEPDDKEIAQFLLIQLELMCRPGELASLLMDDINLSDTDCIFRDTKNGTDRNSHLTPAAIDMIAEQLVQAEVAGSPYLFWSKSRDRQRFVPYNYAWRVKKLKKKNLVGPDFKPYAIRKEAISRGMESGLDLSTLQLMSGHKTLQALEKYKVDLIISDSARDRLDKHSAEQMLSADAHLNSQLPEAVALARAQSQFAALPPSVQAQFLKKIAEGAQ